MNDFTKEELFFIHDLIHDFLIGRDHEIADKSWMKIKSMIDNYCEHEFYEHKKLGEICKKCGEINNDN
ncbi:hypothetical protein ACKJL9_06340 [Legionella pneumophila]|uniref:hypothetical protein n=1 Tax=Legionella pneumophila TaxID=446 RepID=UPI003986B47F